VAGRELTIGILGDQALPILEIIPKGGFYDFNNKYPFSIRRPAAERSTFVRQTSTREKQKEIQELALRAFRSAGLQVYARVDAILSDNGQPYILEINTIPGMTEASLLPEAAAAAGIGYPDLCARIIALSRLRQGYAGQARPEQKANDEFSPKNFPNAQSATVQCAATSAATPARRESSFAQSDPAPHSQRDGRAVEDGFLRDFVRSRLRRCREAVKRLVFENPDYHVQTIELQTDGTLQREQVLKAAGLHEGANIFSVNLASMRDRIQQLPKPTKSRSCENYPAKSIFALSNENRSPGSPAKGN
jgi:D-alanine-D-alanine ligase and related ATP-grasp enzymes